MSVVCLDTQILFWAIEGSGADRRLTESARAFLEWLEKNNHHIIIPSVVVGEMLVPIQETRVQDILRRFEQDWMIVDYDTRSATIFARMRRDHALKDRMKSLQDLQGATRRELVADTMIIATAIAHNANVLYSHDEDLRELAQGWIKAKNFIDENFQLNLL